jgi:hypothetical protein
MPVRSFLGTLNTASLSLNVRKGFRYTHYHGNFLFGNGFLESGVLEADSHMIWSCIGILDPNAEEHSC